MSLSDLINQLELSLHSNQYYLALFTALTVPDIAAAIASEDGTASRNKYIHWYDEWVKPVFLSNIKKILPPTPDECLLDIENPFDGETCYYYRCAMLHQARSTHPRLQYSRVIFIEPQSVNLVAHYNILQDALVIDIGTLCQEIIEGFRNWEAASSQNPNYRRNIQSTLMRHEDGLAPYIDGAPVIS